jgi:hypothetical protein
MLEQSQAHLRHNVFGLSCPFLEEDWPTLSRGAVNHHAIDTR